jgi:ribosomal protein S19
MKHLTSFKLFEGQDDRTGVIADINLLEDMDRRLQENPEWEEFVNREFDEKGVDDWFDWAHNGGDVDKALEYGEKLCTGVTEGKTFKATKVPYEKDAWDEDKKEIFRKTIKDHVKSQNCTTKQVGNDFEIHCGDKHIVQVMFRDTKVAIKKIGTKFPKEFKYTDLGKIKSELTEIIKSCK